MTKWNDKAKGTKKEKTSENWKLEKIKTRTNGQTNTWEGSLVWRVDVELIRISTEFRRRRQDKQNSRMRESGNELKTNFERARWKDGAKGTSKESNGDRRLEKLKPKPVSKKQYNTNAGRLRRRHCRHSLNSTHHHHHHGQKVERQKPRQ